ncbi:unnamed protein product [Albugo candida]|uniref:LisH domain-containing protein n=1 Tax=Albugo candida TaxID=65357 RepID=A0A024FXK8_9STRA|nr:unnamed protein product [Albugo candida]|eukprot:CCI39299.1 unnamed protein product [Albugo candida]
MLETLTDKELELKRSVQETLQTQGVLAKLKAELRSAVFQVLQQQNVQSKSVKTCRRREKLIAENAREYAVSLELCLDFLKSLELDHTFSVLRTEANCSESDSNVVNYRRHLLQEFKLPLTAESCEKPVLFDLMKTFWTLPAENQQSVLEGKATDHILEYEVHPSSGEDSDSAHSDTAPEILSTASTVDCSERENKSTKLSAFMHHGYLGNMTKADDVNTRKGDKDQVEIREDEEVNDDDEHQLGTLDAKLQAMEAEDETGILEKLRATLLVDQDRAEDPDSESDSSKVPSHNITDSNLKPSARKDSVDQDANYGSDFEEEEFEEEIASEISEASSLEQASQASVISERDAELVEQIQKDKVVLDEIALQSYDYIEAIEHPHTL